MSRFPSPMALTALTALTLAACGGDEGGGGKGSEVTDPMTVEQAKGTATASQQLTTLMPGADASTAQGPISQVGNSMHALVGQFRNAKLMAQASGLETAGQAQTAENEIKYENDHLSANLVYAQSNVSFSYAVELDLPATESGRTIDGTFDMNFEATNAQYTVKYSYNGLYKAFQLDTAGCAVGGGLTVDYDWALGGELFDNLPADQRSQVEDQMGGAGKVTVEFGPGCGEVKVFGK